MKGERASNLAGIAIAAALGLWTVLLLTRGSVTIGAGDSAGFDRPVRDILRAANRALDNTGWSDPWRVGVWVCGAGAIILAVVLVWLASGEGDARPRPVEGHAVAGDGRTAASPSGANGHANAEPEAPHPAEARGDVPPGTTGPVA